MCNSLVTSGLYTGLLEPTSPPTSNMQPGSYTITNHQRVTRTERYIVLVFIYTVSKIAIRKVLEEALCHHFQCFLK